MTTTIDLGDGLSARLLDVAIRHACGHVATYPPQQFDLLFAGDDDDDEDGPAGEPCPACREAMKP